MGAVTGVIGGRVREGVRAKLQDTLAERLHATVRAACGEEAREGARDGTFQQSLSLCQCTLPAAGMRADASWDESRLQ
eukprot:gene54606-17394_t